MQGYWPHRQQAGSYRVCISGFTDSSSPLDRLAPLPMHANRHFALERHPPHDALLGPVIVHRVMLGRTVIPDRHIAALPAPAHGVFQTRHMALQQVEQMRRVRQRIALDTFDEVPQQQTLLTADGMYPHHRMLGLVYRRSEDL